MAKQAIIWACQDCGEEQTTWAGRCAACGAWNTLKEIRFNKPLKGGFVSSVQNELQPIRLRDHAPESSAERLVSQVQEVDRVLGGGFFPGSVLLLAGEPGVGKSTLLLAIAQQLSAGQKVLYISGEESVNQIADRARRLQIKSPDLQLVSATDLPAVLHLLAKELPAFVIIDSIQTLADPTLPSVAGSMIQVRQAALQLTAWAKTSGTTLLLVGHVTKEGVAAGPRILEHIVDVVLYLEGEKTSELRILRAMKNRFGPTDEVGIFEMDALGLHEVSNPSARFLEGLNRGVPGAVATVVLEGRRPIMVEIQALIRKTTAVYPRRTGLGIDGARLELLLAVLEARAGLRLGGVDCFVNVSGGLKIREPAADLAVALAIASAFYNRSLSDKLVAFGEIGLGGEIRRVPQADRRADEAKRLGYTETLSEKTVRAALVAAGLTQKDK